MENISPMTMKIGCCLMVLYTIGFYILYHKMYVVVYLDKQRAKTRELIGCILASVVMTALTINLYWVVGIIVLVMGIYFAFVKNEDLTKRISIMTTFFILSILIFVVGFKMKKELIKNENSKTEYSDEILDDDIEQFQNTITDSVMNEDGEEELYASNDASSFSEDSDSFSVTLDSVYQMIKQEDINSYLNDESSFLYGVADYSSNLTVEERLNTIGYVIDDLDGDGIDDLIVGTNEGECLAILMTANNSFLKSVYRNNYYRISDTTILNVCSSGYGYDSFDVIGITPRGFETICSYQQTLAEDGEEILCTVTNENSTVTDISLDEYYAKYEEYYNARTRFPVLTGFEGNALIEQSEGNTTFDVVVAAPDGGVNVRSGAGTEYEILAEMVPNGTVMQGCDIADKTNGSKWIKVNYCGIEGYVAASQMSY